MMPRYRQGLVFSLGMILMSAYGVCGGEPVSRPPQVQPRKVSEMLKPVMPAVVNIAARGNAPTYPQDNNEAIPRFEGLGSGVIIDQQHGYIVTNAHVIRDSESITVTLRDGRSMVARVVGSDVASDIAVLKITAKRIQSAKFGDSDRLEVGDFVCAIGSPFGLQQTVTYGMVSGLERNGLRGSGYENFIQTDAPINPGNSGGALVNMQGEVVGINTAIIAPIPVSSGIGMAVPSNTAKSIVDQLIRYGRVRRGVVGIAAQDITPALAEALRLKTTQGALISQVIENAPAAQAGFKSQDVILKVMGKPVHSAAQIGNTVSLLPIGARASFQVLRRGKLLEMAAVVADPEELQKNFRDAPKTLLAGMELANFSQLVDGRAIQGVEVLCIDDASVAYSCGLRAGDVILAAANQPVKSLDRLQGLSKNSRQLLLEIKRGMGGNVFLVLEG